MASPRTAQLKKFNAPTGGWVSNRNLATPNSQPDAPQGAAVLDNFFPTATTAVLRRGKELYATLGANGETVTSIFKYLNGNNKRLFASTDTTIYDITSVPVPDNYSLVTENGDYLSDENGNHFAQLSTYELEVYENTLGGNWIVAQFATSGNVFIVGVNGESDGFIYDGAVFWPYVAGGVWALSYDNEVTPFTVGEVVTGGTSGATGTIIEIVAGGGLVLTGEAGDFEDNETITGSLGGEATASSFAENLAPGPTFSGSITSANMSYVWVYKNRLWFVEKDTLNVWYMDSADSVGGTVVRYPMGAIFGQGGACIIGETWSLDSGAEGGLSEQMVVISNEGEVAVFQGTDPSQATTWSKVGVYRIGRPLGNKAHFRGGGDIAVCTTVGLVPLSQAIQLDVTASPAASISYNIQDAWNDAVYIRGGSSWVADIWPDRKMALISPPVPTQTDQPTLFVVNSETGAWCRFTNWDVRCMEVFDGQLYFGSPGGKVYKANVTGKDDDTVYSGLYVPLFDDLGSPISAKIPRVGRGLTRSSAKLNYSLKFIGDFKSDYGPAPTASASPFGATWGTAVWGVSTWGEMGTSVTNLEYKSLGGYGRYVSLAYQVTSGGINPLDVEIVSMEMTYTLSEMLT